MISLMLLLLITAFITTMLSAIGRCPIWIPVFLLTILHLLSILPR